ncbi:MAG TPA: crossover junction endodeoxyribonuclease RuvC [Eubacteriales bacterium]|nr:crossover junction endodeoxyribonuclease RuvC [Eubacteriales bacterium]
MMGIDPGLATIGYGILNSEKGLHTVVDYGVMTTPAKTSIPERLRKIEAGCIKLYETYKPDAVAIEELFFTKNVTNGILVAQARGVILLTLSARAPALYEYTPNQIKQGLTGYGGAEKYQVQQMVKALLKLKEIPRPDDAADALAIALCHATLGKLCENFRIT